MAAAEKYEVTGRGVERTVEGDGVAVSLALYHACRPEAGEGAWYVRPAGGGKPVYVVEREPGGIVTVKRGNGS